MAKVFVITGPSGVGKGTLISGLLDRMGELELSTSATTRDPAGGGGGRARVPLPLRDDFAARAESGEFLEHATFSGNRYGTLRSEVERCLDAGVSLVLEIEVQGARQVRAAMPEESVLIFIAPPDPAVLRERLAGRGTDSAEAIERRLETAKQELEAQQEFKHVVVNEDIEGGRGRAGADRSRRAGLRRRCRPPTTLRRPMIKPRVDKLLDQTDSHYAAVLVAAKRARQLNSYYRALGEGTYEEYTPPMVETATGNYLTIALEELAQGKIKYQYRA